MESVIINGRPHSFRDLFTLFTNNREFATQYIRESFIIKIVCAATSEDTLFLETT